MTTITFHGDRTPDGRAAGRPRTGMMSSRDPVTAAKVAKHVVAEGKWRTLPGRDDRARILTAIGSQAHWVVLALTPDMVEMLPALGKELPQGGCHWCSAFVQRFPEPELPRDPANVALLGNGCHDCQRRWKMAELTAAAAREELAHLDIITGGGAITASAVQGLERARRLVAQAGNRRGAGRY